MSERCERTSERRSEWLSTVRVDFNILPNVRWCVIGGKWSKLSHQNVEVTARTHNLVIHLYHALPRLLGQLSAYLTRSVNRLCSLSQQALFAQSIGFVRSVNRLCKLCQLTSLAMSTYFIRSVIKFHLLCQHTLLALSAYFARSVSTSRNSLTLHSSTSLSFCLRCAGHS